MLHVYWNSVVRDYTLAMLGSEKLVALQRPFVKELLGSQSSWEPVSSEKVPKGKELDFFVSGGALQYVFGLASATRRGHGGLRLACTRA